MSKRELHSILSRGPAQGRVNSGKLRLSRFRLTTETRRDSGTLGKNASIHRGIASRNSVYCRSCHIPFLTTVRPHLRRFFRHYSG